MRSCEIALLPVSQLVEVAVVGYGDNVALRGVEFGRDFGASIEVAPGSPALRSSDG